MVFAVTLPTLLCFAGCTTPPTYKVRADTSQRLTALHALRAAPLDIEVFEISAGGVREKHDELTSLVGSNVANAVNTSHGLNPVIMGADLATGPARTELDEVQALLRAIALNDAMPFGGVAPANRGPQPLTYEVGRIDRMCDALGADAVLFMFVRDEYSTGGRKAVMALAMVAGAAAGVAITPAMGATISSAALVERDGRVIWFNELGAAGLDLRNPRAAADWAKKLMAGLPPVSDGAGSSPGSVPLKD